MRIDATPHNGEIAGLAYDVYPYYVSTKQFRESNYPNCASFRPNIMSASPPKETEVEQASPDDPDAQMNDPQDPHASGAYEFEVKEQDRWLPIANGQLSPDISLIPLSDLCAARAQKTVPFCILKLAVSGIASWILFYYTRSSPIRPVNELGTKTFEPVVLLRSYVLSCPTLPHPNPPQRRKALLQRPEKKIEALLTLTFITLPQLPGL